MDENPFFLKNNHFCLYYAWCLCCQWLHIAQSAALRLAPYSLMRSVPRPHPFPFRCSVVEVKGASPRCYALLWRYIAPRPITPSFWSLREKPSLVPRSPPSSFHSQRLGEKSICSTSSVTDTITPSKRQKLSAKYCLSPRPCSSTGEFVCPTNWQYQHYFVFFRSQDKEIHLDKSTPTTKDGYHQKWLCNRFISSDFELLPFINNYFLHAQHQSYHQFLVLAHVLAEEGKASTFSIVRICLWIVEEHHNYTVYMCYSSNKASWLLDKSQEMERCTQSFTW